MTTWNYRVLRRIGGEGMTHYYMFAVHEVYYDDLGFVDGWTEMPDAPFGDTLDELRADYRMMAEALELPVLDYETGKEVEG